MMRVPYGYLRNGVFVESHMMNVGHLISAMTEYLIKITLPRVSRNLVRVGLESTYTRHEFGFFAGFLQRLLHASNQDVQVLSYIRL